VVEPDLVSSGERYRLISSFGDIPYEHKFKTAGGPIILYAAALFTVGVIMVLLNCFFVEIKPRFSLPMMEFLLLSIMILLSLIFRGCTSVSRGQSSQNLP